MQHLQKTSKSSGFKLYDTRLDTYGPWKLEHFRVTWEHTKIKTYVGLSKTSAPKKTQHTSIYIYTYIYIYVCVCVFIYLFICLFNSINHHFPIFSYQKCLFHPFSGSIGTSWPHLGFGGLQGQVRCLRDGPGNNGPIAQWGYLRKAHWGYPMGYGKEHCMVVKW
jgi:hypothetical protein